MAREAKDERKRQLSRERVRRYRERQKLHLQTLTFETQQALKRRKAHTPVPEKELSQSFKIVFHKHDPVKQKWIRLIRATSLDPRDVMDVLIDRYWQTSQKHCPQLVKVTPDDVKRWLAYKRSKFGRFDPMTQVSPEHNSSTLSFDLNYTHTSRCSSSTDLDNGATMENANSFMPGHSVPEVKTENLLDSEQNGVVETHENPANEHAKSRVEYVGSCSNIDGSRTFLEKRYCETDQDLPGGYGETDRGCQEAEFVEADHDIKCCCVEISQHPDDAENYVSIGNECVENDKDREDEIKIEDDETIEDTEALEDMKPTEHDLYVEQDESIQKSEHAPSEPVLISPPDSDCDSSDEDGIVDEEEFQPADSDPTSDVSYYSRNVDYPELDSDLESALQDEDGGQNPNDDSDPEWMPDVVEKKTEDKDTQKRRRKKSTTLKISNHKEDRRQQCRDCKRMIRVNTFTHVCSMFKVNKPKNPDFPKPCDKCGKVIKQAGKWARHLEKHENETVERICELCGLQFRNQNELTRHKRSSHRERKPGACDICGGKFSSTGTLKAHIQSIHLGLRNKMCDRCGKKFKTGHALIIHKRIHSGEKPFKCHLCDYRGRQKHALNWHLQSTHQLEIVSVSSVRKR